MPGPSSLLQLAEVSHLCSVERKRRISGQWSKLLQNPGGNEGFVEHKAYLFILRQPWHMESPDLCMEGTPRSGWTLSAPTACVQYYSTATWQGKEGALGHVHLGSPCSFLPRVKGKIPQALGCMGWFTRSSMPQPGTKDWRG